MIENFKNNSNNLYRLSSLCGKYRKIVCLYIVFKNTNYITE